MSELKIDFGGRAKAQNVSEDRMKHIKILIAMGTVILLASTYVDIAAANSLRAKLVASSPGTAGAATWLGSDALAGSPWLALTSGRGGRIELTKRAQRAAVARRHRTFHPVDRRVAGSSR
ncbi:MAG TPA: hypothetical protein VJ770_28825 [Stellaceae bacterium]|nr:hypothetical protein [Stellaceae bacterium]